MRNQSEKGDLIDEINSLAEKVATGEEDIVEMSSEMYKGYLVGMVAATYVDLDKFPMFTPVALKED